jgi:hypothetical protein
MSTLFSGQYLRNHWTLDIGVLGYFGIVWPKEHSPEIRSFPPGTPCIFIYTLSNAVCRSCNGDEAPFCPYWFVLSQTRIYSAEGCTVFGARLRCKEESRIWCRSSAVKLSRTPVRFIEGSACRLQHSSRLTSYVRGGLRALLLTRWEANSFPAIQYISMELTQNFTTGLSLYWMTWQQAVSLHNISLHHIVSLFS